MSDSDDQQPRPAISVKGITKTFKIPLDKGQSVKNKILGRAGRGYREFTPLNNISFTVYEGDFFGIVGRNGSGKSTLLKTIAGIYEPTAGKVTVQGTLVPFIELGVGFNPQLTGRENVYLNAALMGFSRAEIDEMYDDIVDFAELNDFMEERLQNYSSGMQVRLAFSIAIRADGDVLLLDEVLAVGDQAFQQKCYDYFEQLKRDKKTVILVTHSMANVERFCNRGLLLNDGEIHTIGSSDEVADSYRNLFASSKSAGGLAGQVTGSGGVLESVDCRLDTVQTVAASQVEYKQPFSVIVEASIKDRSYSDFNFVIEIRNSRDLLIICESYTSLKHEYMQFDDSKITIRFDVDNILTNGNYYLSAKAIASDQAGARKDVYVTRNTLSFSVVGGKYNMHSLTHPKIEVTAEGASFIPMAED